MRTAGLDFSMCDCAGLVMQESTLRTGVPAGSYSTLMGVSEVSKANLMIHLGVGHKTHSITSK